MRSDDKDDISDEMMIDISDEIDLNNDIETTQSWVNCRAIS